MPFQPEISVSSTRVKHPSLSGSATVYISMFRMFRQFLGDRVVPLPSLVSMKVRNQNTNDGYYYYLRTISLGIC